MSHLRRFRLFLWLCPNECIKMGAWCTNLANSKGSNHAPSTSYHLSESDRPLKSPRMTCAGSLESDALYGGKDSWLDLLKPLAKRMLKDIMQVELSEFFQAAKSERTAQRRGYRNGYREVTIK